MKGKKFITISMIIFMICMLTLPVFAAVDLAPESLNDSIKVGDEARDSITSFVGQIVGILQVVGTVIAVLILVVLGIKYMMGSAEEKAEYKKTMMPYLVGALLIFAAVTIANMVYNFTSTLQ